MRLTQKLHSRRGASILLALLFFLVCGFVGAVVLGSAVANAEKLQGRREDQQTYYAVSSAARLLQTALDGTRCVGEETKIIYRCASGENQDLNWDPALHQDTYPSPTFDLTAGDGELANLLYTAAESVFKSQILYSTPSSFSGWKKDFTITAEDLPDVQVHMSIDAAYTAVYTLQTETGGYAMTLTCPANVALPPAREVITENGCSHTLIETDESGKEVRSQFAFDYTTYTRTTTVTWPSGTITKGVADSEP